MYEITSSRMVTFILQLWEKKTTRKKNYFDQFHGIQYNNLSRFPIKYLTYFSYADTVTWTLLHKLKNIHYLP